jgi:hypothetical protein
LKSKFHSFTNVSYYSHTNNNLSNKNEEKISNFPSKEKVVRPIKLRFREKKIVLEKYTSQRKRKDKGGFFQRGLETWCKSNKKNCTPKEKDEKMN